MSNSPDPRDQQIKPIDDLKRKPGIGRSTGQSLGQSLGQNRHERQDPSKGDHAVEPDPTARAADD